MGQGLGAGRTTCHTKIPSHGFLAAQPLRTYNKTQIHMLVGAARCVCFIFMRVLSQEAARGAVTARHGFGSRCRGRAARAGAVAAGRGAGLCVQHPVPAPAHHPSMLPCQSLCFNVSASAVACRARGNHSLTCNVLLESLMLADAKSTWKLLGRQEKIYTRYLQRKHGGT